MSDNLFNPPKTVRLDLVGLNANAMVLLAEFRRAARKQGWEQDDIAKVVEEAMSSNYEHLLYVLQVHTVPEGDN